MKQNIDLLLNDDGELSVIVKELLNLWPNHAAFLDRYFADCDSETVEFLKEIAALICKIAGRDLEQYLGSYRWVCGEMLALEFKRRKSNSQGFHAALGDVKSNIYGDQEMMSSYMRGLLISQLFWRQHGLPLKQYKESFLGRLPKDYTLLEIGPGHGLSLALAAQQQNCGELYGWDIAEESLTQTRDCFELLSSNQQVHLARRDICHITPTDRRFDGVVISQVLEVVESPLQALQNTWTLLKPGGKAFFNIPVNMAALDHTRSWHSSAEVDALIDQVGFRVDCSHQYNLLNARDSSEAGFSFVLEVSKPAF